MAFAGLPIPSENVRRAESVDPHVREVIQQEIDKRLEKDKRAKLTWSTPKQAWSQRGVRGPEGVEKFVGKPIGTDGFDMKLPYMSYNGEYYVQNCRIYLSNGQRIKLSEVRNDALPYHAPCPHCRERNTPCTVQEYVGRQLEVWKKQAMELDPMLCRYCFEFTAPTPDEYADHLATMHPDHLGMRLGLGLATPGTGTSSGSSSTSEGGTAEAAPSSPPPSSLDVPRGTTTVDDLAAAPIPVSMTPPNPAPVVKNVSHICGEIGCGRRFQKQSALKRHLTVTHNRRG